VLSGSARFSGQCTEYWRTPKLNPGFCPHTNPGLRVWKRASYPGFRVPGLHSRQHVQLKHAREENRAGLRTINYMSWYHVNQLGFGSATAVTRAIARDATKWRN